MVRVGGKSWSVTNNFCVGWRVDVDDNFLYSLNFIGEMGCFEFNTDDKNFFDKRPRTFA